MHSKLHKGKLLDLGASSHAKMIHVTCEVLLILKKMSYDGNRCLFYLRCGPSFPELKWRLEEL